MKKTERNTSATLIMGSSHIGNILDTPPRLLDAIKQASLIVVEEIKPARALLKKAGITREIIQFNEHNQLESLSLIRTHFEKGLSVLYCSDQGCPSLEDPGAQITKLAFEMERPPKIQVIPGPSSLSAAISACPIPLKGFHFAGFLPREKKERDSCLKLINKNTVSTILMETPYSRNRFLTDCIEILSPSRIAFLALDISGENEMYLYGSLKKLKEKTASLPKLNFIAVISPNDSIPFVNSRGKVNRK